MSKSISGAKRFLRLQFSLASLLVLTTLSAVGLWYWYQRPYLVENKITSVADPFAAPAGPGKKNWDRRDVEYVRRVWGGKTVRHGPMKVYDNQDRLLRLDNYRNGEKHGESIRYEPAGKPSRVETYANGKRHGPSRWSANGTLIAEENYNRDLREGKFEYWHPDGTPFVHAAFHDGHPVGQWSWFPAPAPRGRPVLPSDFLRRPQLDLTLPTVVPITPGRPGGSIVGQWREFLPDGRWEWRDPDGNVYLSAEFVDGRLTKSEPPSIHPRTLEGIQATAQLVQPFALFFSPVCLEFNSVPLKDVVVYIQQTASIPLRIDGRALQHMGLSFNMPITARVEDAPLLIALNELFKPHNLACDFRYGTICVVPADSIENWQDKTGVTELSPPPGSRVAAEWNRTTTVDMVEMPLKDVCLYLSEVHQVRIDPTLMPARSKPGSNAATIDAPVTVSLRGVTLCNALGVILDSLDCQASLEGERIVIQPQSSQDR